MRYKNTSFNLHFIYTLHQIKASIKVAILIRGLTFAAFYWEKDSKPPKYNGKRQQDSFVV